uniref:Cytochrome P450 n=1 Tax=Solanum lycopersicum TaxID=4081 RepID=A0A3Q7GQ47_SOLLC
MMKNPNIMAEVREVFRGKKNYDDEEDLEKLTYLKLDLEMQTNVDGYTIPLKTKVLINKNPESFIPERFDFMENHFEFIPFGAGRRIYFIHFEWELPYGMNPKDLNMTETCGLGGWKQKDCF